MGISETIVERSDYPVEKCREILDQRYYCYTWLWASR